MAWVLPCAAVDTAETERMEHLLDASELDRSHRFRLAPDRAAFACAHALLRTMLSAVLPRPPWEWRFVADACGRPLLEAAQDSVPVRFSLTHTHGLAACVLGFGHDVGIDAEEWAAAQLLDSDGDWLTETERGGLGTIASPQREDRAVRLWTLKEAAVKAAGRGLHQPLGELGFMLDPPCFAAKPTALSGFWNLAQMSPTAGHVIAVAVRSGRRTDVHISIEVLGSLD